MIKIICLFLLLELFGFCKIGIFFVSLCLSGKIQTISVDADYFFLSRIRLINLSLTSAGIFSLGFASRYISTILETESIRNTCSGEDLSFSFSSLHFSELKSSQRWSSTSLFVSFSFSSTPCWLHGTSRNMHTSAVSGTAAPFWAWS